MSRAKFISCASPVKNAISHYAILLVQKLQHFSTYVTAGMVGRVVVYICASLAAASKLQPKLSNAANATDCLDGSFLRSRNVLVSRCGGGGVDFCCCYGGGCCCCCCDYFVSLFNQ